MNAAAHPVATAPPPRLLHLQILRAIAASLVVVDHSILSLDRSHLDVHTYLNPAYHIGNIGVDAFFVLSGFIMVRQSAGLFGSLRGALTFAWHRILRIVPLYWLATLIWLAFLHHWRLPVPHTARQLMLSFAFIPNYLSTYGLDYPILQQGWTLNYEMAFYFLFTLAILLPRRIGIPAVILVTSFFGLGHLQQTAQHLHTGRVVTHLVHFYNQWFVIQFAVGALIGAIEIKLMRFTRPSISISPAWLLTLLPILLIVQRTTLGALTLWHPVAYFAMVVAALCTVVTLQHPGRFNRLLVLCGDASYSTYLTHGLALTAALPNWLDLAPHLRLSPANPVGIIVVGLLEAHLLGLAVHFAIERPITRALRRIKLPPSLAATA